MHMIVDRKALWNVLKFMMLDGSYWDELRHFKKRQVHMEG